jgi:hypothetical protein
MMARSASHARATAAILLFTTLSVPPARADDPREHAARAYDDARKAFDGGAYQAAALGFERVYQEVPNGASMLAAARAWEKANEPALAADDYRSAIAMDDLGPDETAKARQSLAALDNTLGQFRATGPKGTIVMSSHATLVQAPASLYARPGALTVRVTLPDGSGASRSVVIERGRVAAAEFASHSAEAGPVSAGSPAPPSSNVPKPGPSEGAATNTAMSSVSSPLPAASAGADAGSRHASRKPLRTAAFLTGGGALATGLASAILAGVFSSKNSAWNASTRTDASLRTEVVTLQVATDSTFLTACALAVTSATLFVVSLTSSAPRGEPSAHVEVGPAYLGLHASF